DTDDTDETDHHGSDRKPSAGTEPGFGLEPDVFCLIRLHPFHPYHPCAYPALPLPEASMDRCQADSPDDHLDIARRALDDGDPARRWGGGARCVPPPGPGAPACRRAPAPRGPWPASTGRVPTSATSPCGPTPWPASAASATPSTSSCNWPPASRSCPSSTGPW